MAIEFSKMFADIFSWFILAFFFLLMYSKFKKQSMRESWEEIKELVRGIIGQEEEIEEIKKPWEINKKK